MTPFARQWSQRHRPAAASGWAASQRICPTCHHYFTPGEYRAHLRSLAHREQRGWWRRALRGTQGGGSNVPSQVPAYPAFHRGEGNIAR